MDANTLATMANNADSLRWSRWQSIANRNIKEIIEMNTNDANLASAETEKCASEEYGFDPAPVTTIETRMLFIYVPQQDSGKVVSWLVSDPLIEDGDMKFNKDFRLAFEFKDANHARQAYNFMVAELGYEDARVFGDMVL